MPRRGLIPRKVHFKLHFWYSQNRVLASLGSPVATSLAYTLILQLGVNVYVDRLLEMKIFFALGRPH